MAFSKNWIKLDNAAKIFPAASSRKWMDVFRLSAEMHEPIDKEVLYQALQRTLKRMPSFSTRLRKGLFWYYLEHIDDCPDIEEDSAFPCKNIDFKKNRGFMFRALYHKNRIALEIFHVLADGTGGLIFLKTLVAEYTELKYGVKIPRDNTILDCSVPPDKSEYEDSYLTHSKNIGRFPRGQNAYTIRGTYEPPGLMHVTTGLLSVEKISLAAKEYNVSITEFLAGILILAIAKIQRQDSNRRLRNKPIKVCIPIDLRKHFPSNTLRNFASYIHVGIEPKYGEYTLEETLQTIHNYLALENTKKLLNAKMSSNVNAEKNKFLRAAPLILKNPALKIAYRMKGDRQSSTILSNLGRAGFPKEMHPYLSRVDLMLGRQWQNRVALAVISYEDKLVLNFTRSIKESYIERNFFSSLVQMGFHVLIESNQRY
jgi:NRPS condensation-like uncharacterized protein